MRTLYCYAHPDGQDPHEIVLELDDHDEELWAQRRSEEASEFEPDDSGAWLRITELTTGNPVDVRTVACGLGCRCAAQARLVT